MRLTRGQLRKIIAEAIRKPSFSKVRPEEIDAVRKAARDKAEIDDMIGPELVAKLKAREQEPGGKDQVASLYQAYGSKEPDFTSATEDKFYKALLDYYPDMRPEQIRIIANFTEEASKSFCPLLEKEMKADKTTKKLYFNTGLAAVRGFAGGYYESDKPKLSGEPYSGIAIHLDKTYKKSFQLTIQIRGGKASEQLKTIKKFIKALY